MRLRVLVLSLLIFAAAFGAHEVMHLVVIFAVGGRGSIIVRPWRLGLVDFQIPSLHAQPVEPLGLVQQALVNFLGPALAAVPLVALWAGGAATCPVGECLAPALLRPQRDRLPFSGTHGQRT